MGTIALSRFLFFTLLFHLFLGSIVLGQEPVSIHLTHLNGLPSMTVYSMVQDQKGFMWMGTANGLCRYDGKSFKIFNHPNFKDNEILKLRLDKFDRIWFINLSGQLFFLENDKIQEIDFSGIANFGNLVYFNITSDKMFFSFLNFPNSDGNNLMYIAYFDLNNLNKPIAINVLDQNFKLCFEFNVHNDKIRYLTSDGYNEIDFDQNDSLYLNRIEFDKKLLSYAAGNVYFKLGNNDLIKTFCLENYNKEEKHPDLNFKITGKNIDGKSWYITNKGIYHQNTVTGQLKLGILKDINCNTIFIDSEENMWIGTDGSGLFIIPNLDLQLYNEKNSNLQRNEITSILYENCTNKLLIGGSNGNFSKLDSNGNFENYSLGFDGKVQSIYKGPDNAISILADYGLALDNAISKNSFFPSEGFKVMLRDSKSHYWFGRHKSVSRVPASHIDRFKKHTNSSKHDFTVLKKRTYALFEDFDNNIWIGSTSGLYYLPDSLSLTMTPPQKVLSYSISEILQSADSTLLVATTGNGLVRLKNNSILDTITVENGLASNSCKSIYLHNDSLWIGSNQGLNLLNLTTNELSNINLATGQTVNEITDISTFNNQLYLSSPQGLMTFPLDADFSNKNLPIIHISSIKIWDRDTTIRDTLFLNYNQNNLQFDYIGLGFRSPRKINYKYRLQQIESKWIHTQTTTVRYPSLKPGNYLFEVMSINGDGITSEAPASICLIISPPWWQTWWAILTAVLFLSSAIWFIFSRRIKRLKRQERLKQAFQEKVNELEHKALQTQMNPHFIFNSLNAVQHFITNQDEEPALLYLSRFARLIRRIFDFSKQKEITLTEEISFLKNYLQLEQLRFQDKVLVAFSIEEKLENEAMEVFIPPLLIQPIIENAFKHGLFHRNGGGQLKISLFKENESIVCEIEDNGIGRKIAAEKKIMKHDGHKSSGLIIIEERLAIMNNQKRNKSQNYLEIIDLLDTRGKGTGTKVILKIKSIR